MILKSPPCRVDAPISQNSVPSGTDGDGVHMDWTGPWGGIMVKATCRQSSGSYRCRGAGCVWGYGAIRRRRHQERSEAKETDPHRRDHRPEEGAVRHRRRAHAREPVVRPTARVGSRRQRQAGRPDLPRPPRAAGTDLLDGDTTSRRAATRIPRTTGQSMVKHYNGGKCDGFLQTQTTGDHFPIGYYEQPQVPILGALGDELHALRQLPLLADGGDVAEPLLPTLRRDRHRRDRVSFPAPDAKRSVEARSRDLRPRRTAPV